MQKDNLKSPQNKTAQVVFGYKLSVSYLQTTYFLLYDKWVKKFFLILFFSTIFLFSSPIFNLAHAACDPDINFTPSPYDPPYTTVTNFYIRAVFNSDCVGGPFQIGGLRTDGGGGSFSSTFNIPNSLGEKVQDANIRFSEIGTWEIGVLDKSGGGAGRLIGHGNGRGTVEITVANNAQIPLACGAEITNPSESIPNCDEGKPGRCCSVLEGGVKCNATLQSGIWRCGTQILTPGGSCNPDLQSFPQYRCPSGESCQPVEGQAGRYTCGRIDPKLEARCNSTVQLREMAPCKTETGAGGSVVSALRCGVGQTGWVCGDVKARLCMNCPDGRCEDLPEFTDYKQSNVRCEILPISTPCKDGKCDTGLGIKFSVDKPQAFINDLFKFALMIAGAAAILILIYAGYIYMTSAGDKTKIQAARETITSAIAGLLFLIFSITILEIIGVDILAIPGFSR